VEVISERETSVEWNQGEQVLHTVVYLNGFEKTKKSKYRILALSGPTMRLRAGSHVGPMRALVSYSLC